MANVQEARKRAEKQKALKKQVLNVIESVLDGPISEDTFRLHSGVLSKSCYSDLTEERALANLCGYPLCDKELRDIHSKNKFKIDLKNNKVYDVTERKHFCSNLCFKASTFYKEQLEEEPLWIRFCERDFSGDHIPKIDIYKEKAGLAGTPVVLKEVIDATIEEENLFEEDEIPVKVCKKTKDISKEPVSLPYIKKEHVEQLQTSMSQLKIVEKNPVNTALIIDPLPRLLTTLPHKVPNQASTVEDIKTIVETVLEEWITPETLLFVYGEEAFDNFEMKEIGDELSNIEQAIKNKKLEESLQRICARLDEEERLDDEDLLLMGSTSKTNAECDKPTASATKVVPKDRTFKKKVQFKEPESVEPKKDDNERQLFAPVSSVTAMRRQIIMTSIRKALIQQTGEQNAIEIVQPLTELVKTFKLTAKNIVHSHEEWSFLILFLLRILLRKLDVNCITDENGIYKSQSVLDLESKFYASNDEWEDKIEKLLDVNKFRS